MKINTLTIEYRRTQWVALITLGCIIAAYLFFVSSSVFNTVALKDAEIQNIEIKSELANLETKYISLEKSIDKTRAVTLGFHDAHTNLFADSSLSASVSSR